MYTLCLVHIEKTCFNLVGQLTVYVTSLTTIKTSIQLQMLLTHKLLKDLACMFQL